MNGETKSGDLSPSENTDCGTAPLARASFGAVRRFWRVVARWSDRRRQRIHLGQLDERLLGDIGVTRVQARREASRWFFE